jgi:hypothetical protein
LPSDTQLNFNIIRVKIFEVYSNKLPRSMRPRKGDAVVVCNRQKSKTNQVVDLAGWKCDNKKFRIQISDVKVVPDSKFNVLSMTKRLNSGWKLGGDVYSIWLSKENNKVAFDLKIMTKKGSIYAMYMHREGPEVNAIQAEADQKINVEKAHQFLGHMSEESTRATAKAFRWEIVRCSLQPSESCAEGKAKQKNVPKKSDHISAVNPGERLYLDISSVMGEKDGPKVNTKRHWCIMVDEATNRKFSDFYQTKDGVVEPTLKKWSKLQVGYGYQGCQCQIG